jgi:hypothetical protein
VSIAKVQTLIKDKGVNHFDEKTGNIGDSGVGLRSGV